MRRCIAGGLLAAVGLVLAIPSPAPGDSKTAAVAPSSAERGMLALLDAPLLFTKRHSYSGIHIYDTYYKWPPGGGGIYVLENPSEPREAWRIRPLIDPTTPDTLGVGVYDDPELSWDATRVLFTFKGEPSGSTRIYEIRVDGSGLRLVSDPGSTLSCYKGAHGGQHDVYPAYLPDDRIVFLSTRPSGLVPCANSGVAILHVMDADGSDIHPISVNNVNEFDPAILPDGRVLFGRWEYVDKNALTIQSLWTVKPDGTQEEALFANNMVFPEAILDARPVPGTSLVVGTFAKHNSTPRGSIAIVDPSRGKNDPAAIENLEHPENPTCDTGDSCEPWPVARNTFLFSGRPPGHKSNTIDMIDRQGRRITVLSDPAICLHSPMLVKPRPRPATIVDRVDRDATTGRFFVQDIYRGLTGVRRGEVRALRVIEETSRVSGTNMGGSPYNQTFLVSAALAFSVKNFLGVVPVEEDGSAYFEVPAGRAVYLQALDREGRLVQSMRTFVQAAPGTTRSCIGCHEDKYSTPFSENGMPQRLRREPSRLEPESWGSGYLDYPGMVQPVLDRHCVRCHGGAEGIAAGMDLSGGWTEHFNISYENLVNRRETQLEAYWIAGIDCMNGTALWSSRIFAPRGHGSGAAPLAELLVEGHEGRIGSLARPERDLLMAWIDTNGLYHGTWNATESGCSIRGWGAMRSALVAEMQRAGCLRCHGEGSQIRYFENDWVNLRDPDLSRILRAPLHPDAGGLGLALCRDRKVDPRRQRIHLLWRGYAHAVQPPEAFPRREVLPPDRSGTPVTSFASTTDTHYRALRSIILEARAKALAEPRVDMPGARLLAGECRTFLPPPVPRVAPRPEALVDSDGVVELNWPRTSETIGLTAEVHRSAGETFVEAESTLLASSTSSRHTDLEASSGLQTYALYLRSDKERSLPACVTIRVPEPAAPPPPEDLVAPSTACAVRLEWTAPDTVVPGYHVYRALRGKKPLERLTAEPIGQTSFTDGSIEPDVMYVYAVRAVSRRGLESRPSGTIEARSTFVKEPMFTLAVDRKLEGRLHGGGVLSGRIHGPAELSPGVLDLEKGGHATLPGHGCFALAQPLSVECWVWFDEAGEMPVVVSCGVWKQAGWFLQKLGGAWRWHVGGVDCDGGSPAMRRWLHVVGTFDGRAACLYENGRLLARKEGAFITTPWSGELHIGQYSGGAGAPYQVRGRVAGLKIYHRPLGADEVAAASRSPPE